MRLIESCELTHVFGGVPEGGYEVSELVVEGKPKEVPPIAWDLTFGFGSPVGTFGYGVAQNSNGQVMMYAGYAPIPSPGITAKVTNNDHTEDRKVEKEVTVGKGLAVTVGVWMVAQDFTIPEFTDKFGITHWEQWTPASGDPPN